MAALCKLIPGSPESGVDAVQRFGLPQRMDAMGKAGGQVAVQLGVALFVDDKGRQPPIARSALAFALAQVLARENCLQHQTGQVLGVRHADMDDVDKAVLRRRSEPRVDPRQEFTLSAQHDLDLLAAVLRCGRGRNVEDLKVTPKTENRK